MAESRFFNDDYDYRERRSPEEDRGAINVERGPHDNEIEPEVVTTLEKYLKERVEKINPEKFKEIYKRALKDAQNIRKLQNMGIELSSKAAEGIIVGHFMMALAETKDPDDIEGVDRILAQIVSIAEGEPKEIPNPNSPGNFTTTHENGLITPAEAHKVWESLA